MPSTAIGGLVEGREDILPVSRVAGGRASERREAEDDFFEPPYPDGELAGSEALGLGNSGLVGIGGGPCGRLNCGGGPCGRLNCGGGPCGRLNCGGGPCGRLNCGGGPGGRLNSGRNLPEREKLEEGAPFDDEGRVGRPGGLGGTWRVGELPKFLAGMGGGIPPSLPTTSS